MLPVAVSACAAGAERHGACDPLAAHHGWEAAKCEVPTWSGGKEAALVVAPAEVEVK